MKAPQPVTIDFETLPIEGRPAYPPVPVGVAIKWPGKKSRYYAWGHADGNNCCWSEAEAALREAYASGAILFQNGKFDLDVAEVHFGLVAPPWTEVHDTLFLLFLDDPNQKELGLKPAAERLLDQPPEERDAVEDWLVEHQPIPGVKISRSKKSDHYAGRYIAFAPADVVGPYANGDADRTEALFKKLYVSTKRRKMLKAYDRERRLMPILLELERQGLPVDLINLQADVATYSYWREQIDAWLIKRLKAPADLNLSSGEQLMAAMIEANVVDETQVPLTATGKLQTNKDALLAGVTDAQLLAMLKYRAQLNTCLNTFMAPWLAVAERSGGLIFTTWNQTKTPKGGNAVGTRTGRLSSTPNFQNIPKEFKAIFRHDDPKNKKLPICPLKGLPTLPRVRSYVVPFTGDVFIDRDYSQQEPRILAHFDGGALMQKYLEDNWIDFHDYAKAELEKVGKVYDRRPVKDINLGLIYGMGDGKLAVKTGLSVEETKSLKAAVLRLYPGLKDMMDDMKTLAAEGLPIRTWGGREYFCEEPIYIDGKKRTFEYKLVNTLIQGSAADCTKEAIIRFHAAKKPTWKIVLQVHDQITVSVPRKDVDEAMEVLRQCMESVEFDVPILSEGSTSGVSWDDLVAYDKKGKRV